MRKIEWPLIEPNQIEVRIATCKDGRTTLLLYQNSRNAMDVLDNTVGQSNWKIEYKPIGEEIYGILSIWDDEKNQWIAKEDTGEQSNIAASKGQSSDILKRCLVRWGYARELYSAPKITIDNNNKYAQYSVYSISYNDNREICGLIIVDSFGNIVYSYGDTSVQVDEIPQQYSEPVEVKGFAPQQTLTEPQQQKLIKLPNPLTDQGMLDKRLYAQIMKAPDKESLINIYNIYSELKNNKFFVSTLQKRKAQLGIPA